VCELVRGGDILTAQGILDAAGITLPTGNLIDGCYDEAGNLYRLPEVVVSDPVNMGRDGDGEEIRVDGSRNSHNIDGETMVGVPESKLAATAEEKMLDGEEGDLEREDNELLERRREEKGKASERDAVKVRCRLSDRGGPDVVIALGKAQHVAILVRKVQLEGNVRLDSFPRCLTCNIHLPDQQSRKGNTDSYHVMNANTIYTQVSPSLHIRLAYLGKILSEKDTLEAQGWKEGHVINAMVVGGIVVPEGDISQS